jgi:hypothetical protein
LNAQRYDNFVLKEMNMNTFLTVKQTEEDIQSNNNVKFNFIYSVINLDEMSVANLLDNKSRYLDNLNKMQTVYWFKKQFSKIPKEYSVDLVEGISIDIYPGAEVLEFNFEQDSDHSFDYSLDDLENKPTNINSKSLKLILVLCYNQGYIIDIKIPKRFIEKDNLEKIRSEN